MDIDNIWVVDVSMLSEKSLEKIRTSGLVGKSVWFAHTGDNDAAAFVYNQRTGVATQIQVVPAPSGRLVIARRSVFDDLLSNSELSSFRGGKDILVVPYAPQDPIVAGSPSEKEVYLIDRQTMRVGVIIC